MKEMKMVVAGIAGAILAVCTAQAETLLWYRFDGDGATIVNKANPGTMDGTMKSLIWGNGVDAQGNDSTKFPVRGDAFPSDVGIIDPASDTEYSGQVKSLSFPGDQSNAGMILLKKANAAPLVNLTSFTCEVFFKIPAAAASRTPALFPLVTWGDDQNQGWKFGFYRSSGTKLSPWFRGVQKTSAGAKGTVQTINAANGNRDNYTYDTWHHLALVVDGAGDGSHATGKLILDYTEVQTATISNYYGFYFNPSSAFPLTIGADMYRNRNDATSRETFMGDIAEFRISNTALATDKLLRPLPSGPVDDDTLVYLPMGDSDWFGTPNTSSYKNIYHGVLNAALTAACTPYWTNGTTSAAYPASAADAAGASVRGGYLATDTFADAKSTTFSRALVSGNYAGHVLRVPYEDAQLAEGSFTLEWFFKTNGPVPSGNGINSYTFMNNSFAKIMINQANGFLLTRLIPAQGQYQDFNSSVRVDDGQWHHYALVYDKDQDAGAFAAYLDYRKIASKSYTLTTGTSIEFYFGGQTPTVQAFAGNLDNLRITKRALKPIEFLTSLEYHDTAIFSHFEDTLATGQYEVFAPDATGTGTAFVENIRKYDYDDDGRPDQESGKALSLGSIVWSNNSLLECRDFTLEWFGKYQSIATGAMLARFEMEALPNTISWALYTPSKCLRLGAHHSDDGVWKEGMKRSDIDFTDNMDFADNRWHHYALVAKTENGKTTFKFYRDREQLGEPIELDGMLAIPTTGTRLTMGTGSNPISGLIDELRFTRSALAPEEFIHTVPSGLLIIVR